MGKSSLRAGINRLLDDGVKVITKSTLVVYGGPTTKAALQDWERKGYLRIIKDLELAEDHEDCVEMLAYIDRPGYPHWP